MLGEGKGEVREGCRGRAMWGLEGCGEETGNGLLGSGLGMC